MTNNAKRISVSQKRQITIPLDYFKALGISNEVECVMKGNAIIIKPVKENAGGEFAEQILEDLVSQGYSGNELLSKFKEQSKKIRPAVEKMIAEADDAAAGKIKSYSFDEVFGSEE